MRLASFLAALLLSSVPAIAQQHAEEPKTSTLSTDTASVPKHRLSIGVALEGGGALGLAHIGVLKWFEEHHIPIDYLAGTSMGGLVGGLYATGKPASQLEEILHNANWPLLLGGGTPYEDLSFRR